MLRATLKSLLARKLRLVLSGLAVTLGVMFVAGAFVVTDTLGRSFDSLFSTAYAGTDVSVSGQPRIDLNELEGEPVATPLPAEVVDRIAGVTGVAEATGVVSADGARLIGSDGKVVASFGPPRLGENWAAEEGLVELREGRGPTADSEIAIDAGLAKAAGVAVGDRVGVLTLEPKRMFTIVGTFGFSGDRDSLGGVQMVAFTTPVAQRLMLGEEGVFTSVTVRAAEGVAPETVRDSVAAALGDGFVVKTGEQLADENVAAFEEGLSFVNYILLGFAGVALFVGIFLIVNTFSILIAQRTRELALLRAVGASRRQMLGSVLVEALVIGVFASVLGLVAGIGVGAVLGWAFGQFSGLPAAGVGVPVEAVVSAFGVGILVTLVAAVLPALRAARIPPIAAMQDVATPDRPLTRLTVAGGLVTAVGGTLLGLGLAGSGGSGALWTILAGVLVGFIGVALLTPLLSRPVVAVLGRLLAWSVPGRLGQRNSGRNPRRTAITAAALMVGIALVTGVTVVLQSAKVSLAAQAEEQIQADLMIVGEMTGPRLPSFDPAVLERAAGIPGVTEAVGVYNDQAVVNGERAYVNGSTDLAALARVYGAAAESGTLTTLEPDQVALDTVAAAEHGVTVGGALTVQLPRGEPHRYTVTAVYPEGALPGRFMLPRAASAEMAVTQPFLGYIQLAAGTPADRVLPALKALVADSPEVSVTDRTGFIAQQSAQFDTVLTMIQVLLALAILIAVLGIINTLALSVLERTRELGLLRAIGLGRGQTMRMITVEAVVISVFGALLGVLVGTGLGAAVVEALRTEGIDRLVLPWAQMGTYLGLAALVGVIAAVLPSIRAARLNVLAAIAHE